MYIWLISSVFIRFPYGGGTQRHNLLLVLLNPLLSWIRCQWFCIQSALRTQLYFSRRARTMTGLIPTQLIKQYDGILLPTQHYSIFWTWWRHSFFLPWDWLKNQHQGKYLKMIHSISLLLWVLSDMVHHNNILREFWLKSSFVPNHKLVFVWNCFSN